MPEDIRNTGIIPIDFSGSESWTGSQKMEPGTCLFELTHWSLPQSRNGKRMLRFHFAILDGPKEGDNPNANRGQDLRRNFVYETEGGRNYCKGLVDQLNPEAWVQKDGKTYPDFAKIVGIKFWSTLTSRTYPGEDGREITGYDLDATRVEVTERPKSEPQIDELPVS